jgi:hypothetical protein
LPEIYQTHGCGRSATDLWRRTIAKAKSVGKYKGRPANIDAAEIRRLTATMGPTAIAKQLGVAL